METVKCTNKTMKDGDFDKYTFSQCGSCTYLYTYKGDHWLDDDVSCSAPLEVSYGDKIVSTIQLVKKGETINKQCKRCGLKQNS